MFALSTRLNHLRQFIQRFACLFLDVCQPGYFRTFYTTHISAPLVLFNDIDLVIQCWYSYSCLVADIIYNIKTHKRGYHVHEADTISP